MSIPRTALAAALNSGRESTTDHGQKRAEPPIRIQSHEPRGHAADVMDTLRLLKELPPILRKKAVGAGIFQTSPRAQRWFARIAVEEETHNPGRHDRCRRLLEEIISSGIGLEGFYAELLKCRSHPDGIRAGIEAVLKHCEVALRDDLHRCTGQMMSLAAFEITLTRLGRQAGFMIPGRPDQRALAIREILETGALGGFRVQRPRREVHWTACWVVALSPHNLVLPTDNFIG